MKIQWLSNFKKWAGAKFGRIVTFVGALAGGVDVFDVSIVKQPLSDFLGNPQLATRILGGVALGCLILSYIRHQVVASRNPKPPDMSATPKPSNPPGATP